MCKAPTQKLSTRCWARGLRLSCFIPFPANHEFWLPAVQALTSRHQVILPDLRGHGDSGVGEGPATMEKHAADMARIMDDAEVARAPLDRGFDWWIRDL